MHNLYSFVKALSADIPALFFRVDLWKMTNSVFVQASNSKITSQAFPSVKKFGKRVSIPAQLLAHCLLVHII